MNLGRKIFEIRTMIQTEEKNNLNLLKKRVANTIENHVEAWIRSGNRNIVVYPIERIGESDAQFDRNQMLAINDQSFLSKQEQTLAAYLREQEGLSLTTFRYSSNVFFCVDLFA